MHRLEREQPMMFLYYFVQSHEANHKQYVQHAKETGLALPEVPTVFL